MVKIASGAGWGLLGLALVLGLTRTMLDPLGLVDGADVAVIVLAGAGVAMIEGGRP